MTTELENQLAELLSGDLPEHEHTVLLEKIKADPEAWEIYTTVVATDNIMEEAPLLSPSARFTKSVLASYDRQLISKQNSKMMFYFSAVAAVFVVAFCAIGLSTSTGPSSLIPQAQIISIGQQINEFVSILDGKNIMMGFVLVNILLFMTVMDKWLSKRIFHL